MISTVRRGLPATAAEQGHLPGAVPIAPAASGFEVNTGLDHPLGQRLSLVPMLEAWEPCHLHSTLYAFPRRSMGTRK